MIFVFGGLLGRHTGFLGSPSFMPIYAGSSINYRPDERFDIRHVLLYRGSGLPQEIEILFAHCHPTILHVFIVGNIMNTVALKFGGI